MLRSFPSACSLANASLIPPYSLRSFDASARCLVHPMSKPALLVLRFPALAPARSIMNTITSPCAVCVRSVVESPPPHETRHLAIAVYAILPMPGAIRRAA
eukprot:4547654-Alexandrium_andersonii.AAC.1